MYRISSDGSLLELSLQNSEDRVAATIYKTLNHFSSLFLILLFVRARQALEETAAKARVEFGGRPLSLEFLGLSSFGGRVVFTQVAEGEEQHKLGQLAGVLLCLVCSYSMFFVVL